MNGAYELELTLRPPEIKRKPYPSNFITLASGEKMVIREARHEELPLLLRAIERFGHQPANRRSAAFV